MSHIAGRGRPRKAPDVNLNLNVRGMGKSATLEINERCQELQSQGKEIYRMGLGQSPFPVPAPVVEELQTWSWKKDYLPVQGLNDLREAVAAYHRKRDNIEVTADNVLIGPGSKELMFLLQLVYYGDLLIPTPAWVSYAPQAQIIGRRVSFLPTDLSHDYKLKPKQLSELCRFDDGRPRILVLNYPSNPTGATYTVSELKALAQVARRYKLIILSDEIYGEVHHHGTHTSIAQFYPQGTIISSGLSKWCGAGGWRIGTFTFPSNLKWLLEGMAAVASETYTSTSAPVQYAAVRAFEGGPEIENYLKICRKILSALGGYIYQRLKASGLSLAKPEGGFYLFPDFSAHTEKLRRKGITTSPQLCRSLLDDTGVALLPGKHFGRPETELTVRIAYVNFDGMWATLAAEELPEDELPDENFLRSYCSPTLKAIDKICDWLSS